MAVADRKPRIRRRSHDMEQVEPRTGSPAVRYVWALARLSLGSVFFWAFVDKLFGLGHETATKQAWIHGGHPTMGFLKFSATGPFKGFYHSIAGAALLLGIGMRLVAIAGAAMLVMMWSVVLPPENHIFMDDHLVYALLIIGLALVGAGNTLGFGRWWGKARLVQRFPILK